MNKEITHKQHYVWREYLKPWGKQIDDKVFVWWNNKRFTKNTDVFDILREKIFINLNP